jgi:hypothetical protein
VPASSTHTLSFTDTPGDDLSPTAILDFFESFEASSTDYLLFSIRNSGPHSPEYCVERADWYQDSYIALHDEVYQWDDMFPFGAGTLGAGDNFTVDSGDWQKWYRLNGGSWSAPSTLGYRNTFSETWSYIGDWAMDQELGNVGVLLQPASPGVEIKFGYLGDFDWTNGVDFTLQVGSTRLETCGF